MTGCALFLALAGCLALEGQCPSEEPAASVSEVRTLEGRLVYHDGLWQWFELKLDRPQCGQKWIELYAESIALEVFRGCRIRSRGSLFIKATGLESGGPLRQIATSVEPVGACTKHPPFPDSSRVEPDKAIREYRVDMRVDYGRGRPILFRVTSAGKELRPWRAYASYLLTGGRILYGQCARGFTVENAFGTPEARPSHYEDDPVATFDPESAAVAGKTKLDLGYTCVRKP